MRSETAAAYVDEPSVAAFNKKVASGVYSQPLRRKGSAPKWLRTSLDRDVARSHGLRFDEHLIDEDVTELI
jgi:hypothetical protein